MTVSRPLPTTYARQSYMRTTVMGDATALPIAASSVDCVLAAEVLEHLPFERVPAALASMRRVVRAAVVITVPAPLLGVAAMLNIPTKGPLRVRDRLPALDPTWPGCASLLGAGPSRVSAYTYCFVLTPR